MRVSAWRGAHAYGAGDLIIRYGTILTFLVPIEDTLLGLGGARCSTRFCMVVGGFSIPLLWQDQENWGFWNIIDLMSDDGVYRLVIFFNITFDCTSFSSDLYHYSKTLDHSIFGAFGSYYKVMDVIGHANGGMIV